MNKLKWYLKQILPLKYVNTFTEKGIRKKCVFRMWFGRCFDIGYYSLLTDWTKKQPDITYLEKLKATLDRENDECPASKIW